MEGQIVQITYKLEGSRDKYVEENLPYAQPTSLQAFLDGPIITDEGRSIPEHQNVGCLEELTITNRGPIKWRGAV